MFWTGNASGCVRDLGCEGLSLLTNGLCLKNSSAQATVGSLLFGQGQAVSRGWGGHTVLVGKDLAQEARCP